jgi:DNA-binding transcriptional ArsR family regulator
MRYRTNQGLLIEADTSLDILRRLREASWNEQKLSEQAYMETVADRLYEQGVHVSTVSPDIFVAGLLAAGLLTPEVEAAPSNETGE